MDQRGHAFCWCGLATIVRRCGLAVWVGRRGEWRAELDLGETRSGQKREPDSLELR